MLAFEVELRWESSAELTLIGCVLIQVTYERSMVIFALGSFTCSRGTDARPYGADPRACGTDPRARGTDLRGCGTDLRGYGTFHCGCTCFFRQFHNNCGTISVIW